ncbi:uracil-DNA glycosylase family protein, partial [uncultured Rothia sp.]|uniref:uracil-DNA glycosylase family protein n=1 Tax=uncultured Rothia sp. TaxID=316088 RepID=UPI0028063BC2
PVFSASPHARIVVIGQAPGRAAQESRIPWNDPSGVKLREWMGVTDEQFYDPDLISLLPMDFYYPGKGAHGDNPPRKDFAPKWHPQLLELMPNVQLILLVGAYSQKHYLDGVHAPKAQKNLTETVRAWESYLPKFLPLVHPSPLNFRWQAKNPWFEQEVVPALQKRVGEVLEGV